MRPSGGPCPSETCPGTTPSGRAKNLPGHDPERTSEGWDRERDAGVYGENGRRGGGLEHVESIVARSVLGRYAAAS